MKKLISIVLGLLISGILVAQNPVQPDPRLSTRYSSDRIQNWMENAPSILELKNFELNYGYEFTQMPDDKVLDLPQLRTFDYQNKTAGAIVNDIEQEGFNLYMYQYDRAVDKANYYRIGNTNTVLIIPSSKKLAEMFNESRNYE